MIDTIKIKLHEINERILNKFKGAEFSETIFGKSNMENKQVNIFYKTFPAGAERIIFFKGKINVPSSNANINYSIRGGTDCMQMEFSVPKLLYETNFFQLIDKSIITTDTLKQSYQATRIFGVLTKFLKKFTDVIYSSEDNNNLVSGSYMHLIEIERIDICFNQMFQTEKDARDYLNYQKRIRKKYMSDKSRYKADWNNSIYLVNQDYTFKIYHKGDEFKKNSYSTYSNLFNREKIQSLSNRTLRYEMEFKSKYISKLFMESVYFNESKKKKYYKSVVKLFYNLKKNKQEIIKTTIHEGKKITNGEKFYKYIFQKTLADFEKTNGIDYGNISAINDFYTKEIRKSRNFYFDKKKRMENFCVMDSGEVGVETDLYFEPELLKFICKKFRQIYKEFQIDTVENLDNIGQKISDFNHRVAINKKWGLEKKSAINKNKMNQLFVLLKTYSWKEILQMNLYSREQIWRHKKRIKELGLNENGQMISHNIKKFDTYQYYYENCISNFGNVPCNFYFE